MKKILFNDYCCLTDAVLQGHKTMTRRVAFDGIINDTSVCYGTEGKYKDRCALCDGSRIVALSRYKVGEVVAIGQSYNSLAEWCKRFDLIHCVSMLDRHETYINQQRSKGWNNKMFVKANLMPHHIRITNIRVERLQDISDNDCLKEGVGRCKEEHIVGYPFGVPFNFYIKEDVKGNRYSTQREAFSVLIDKVSGKGTWNNNPYVFVYDFELVD